MSDQTTVTSSSQGVAGDEFGRPSQASQASQASQPRKSDETVPGGRYLGTDGTYHDSEGNALKEQSTTSAFGSSVSDKLGSLLGSDLPGDFPARTELYAAGIKNIAQVRSANDETLLATKGINPATLARIRIAQGKASQAG